MRILVVDDDPVINALVSEQLGQHGFSVMTADGVEAALELVDRDHPALVLTDIRMAPRDGFALLAEVRARSPRMPVVLMSSLNVPEIVENASRAGADGFLAKPFTESQVLAAVIDALGEHRFGNEVVESPD